MSILPFYGRSDHDRRSLLNADLIRRLCVTFVLIIPAITWVFKNLPNYSISLFPTWTVFVPFEQYESEYAWDIIRPGDRCLRYSTREYTSRLLQPSGVYNSTEGMGACREIPAEIHGRLLKSNWCLDLGFGRGIYGFWTIAFQEPKCETRWGKFKDLGCFENPINASVYQTAESEGTAFRRIESQLENLQHTSNWQIMCVTTPAEIHGRYYSSPGACVYDSVKRGVIGIWGVEDLACH